MVLKIPCGTEFSAFVARNCPEQQPSDLIAHLTWFSVNEKLVADGLLATKIVACLSRSGRNGKSAGCLISR